MSTTQFLVQCRADYHRRLRLAMRTKREIQIDEEIEDFYRQEREDQAQQDYLWERRNVEED